MSRMVNCIIAALNLIVVLGFAQDTPSRLSPELVSRISDGTAGETRVIVQYHSTPTAAHHRRMAVRGGRLNQSLAVVNGAAYTLPASALASLAGDPDVAYATVDHPVSHMGVSSTTMRDYARETIGSISANQSGWTGAGIGVAVIDSGIFNQGDFSNIVYRQSWVTGNGNGADNYGHGTHVAGVIAGNGTWSAGHDYKFGGVAPGVRLIDLTVLDSNGNGTDSNVIAAIQRAIALKSTYNIRVINLSLGRPVYQSYTKDPLCQAVEAAWKAGIVVVVAAGNQGRNNSAGTEGYATIMAPGNDPYVITVGAMRTASSMSCPWGQSCAVNSYTPGTGDRVASFSSKGPTLLDHIVKPDIVAPGHRIISVAAQTGVATLEKLVGYGNYNCPLQQSLCTGNYVPYATFYAAAAASGVSPYYFALSGTSMAAPAVSGAAALLLQKYPSLTPDQVKARLMKTATKSFPSSSQAVDPSTGRTYTSYYDVFTVGAGSLNITAALGNTDTATGLALSPTAYWNASTGQVTMGNTAAPAGSTIVWGTTLVWGTTVVWGTNVFQAGSASTLAGSTIVWGTGSTTGTTVVWGTTLVWGTSTTDAAESLGVLQFGEN